MNLLYVCALRTVTFAKLTANLACFTIIGKIAGVNKVHKVLKRKTFQIYPKWFKIGAY